MVIDRTVCTHRGNWRGNTLGAIAPEHPEYNLQRCRGDAISLEEQWWCPVGALSPLVFIDLPLSRGTHSESGPGRQALDWHPRNPVDREQ